MRYFVLFTGALLLLSPSCVLAFHVDSDDESSTKHDMFRGDLDIEKHFIKTKLYIDKEVVITDPLALQAIAKDTLAYINNHDKDHSHVINPTKFSSLLSLYAVRDTLRFIVETIEEDKEAGNFRILDPDFLNQHFSCIAWRADEEAAVAHGVKLPGNGQIRLTTYAVFSVKGSPVKTATHPCALYHVTNDAMARRFTKQQILAGALDTPAMRQHRRVFAWVSRESLEEALMQGTVLVEMPDGTSKLLAVHLNNNINYNRRLADRKDQARYWYFKALGKSGLPAAPRIRRIRGRAQVVFAGDLHNIGIGKVIVIRYENPQTGAPEMKIGVLADTGGAFKNNLYQLDFFGGLVKSHEALRDIIRQVPIYVRASILYKIPVVA